MSFWLSLGALKAKAGAPRRRVGVVGNMWSRVVVSFGLSLGALKALAGAPRRRVEGNQWSYVVVPFGLSLGALKAAMAGAPRRRVSEGNLWSYIVVVLFGLWLKVVIGCAVVPACQRFWYCCLCAILGG